MTMLPPPICCGLAESMSVDAPGANAGSSRLAVVGIDLIAEATKQSIPLSDSGNANPGLAFRFDPTLGSGGGYIFNLSTKGAAHGTYALRFHIGADDRSYSTSVLIK